MWIKVIKNYFGARKYSTFALIYVNMSIFILNLTILILYYHRLSPQQF